MKNNDQRIAKSVMKISLKSPSVDRFISRNIVGSSEDFKKLLYDCNLKEELEEKDRKYRET